MDVYIHIIYIYMYVCVYVLSVWNIYIYTYMCMYMYICIYPSPEKRKKWMAPKKGKQFPKGSLDHIPIDFPGGGMVSSFGEYNKKTISSCYDGFVLPSLMQMP